MLVSDIIFPISDGLILARWRARLETNWSDGLRIDSQKDGEPLARRLVTLRNDSGPQSTSMSQRRYGGNVWADDPVDAEKIALELMNESRLLPRTVGVIKRVDSFNGPFEILDDPQVTAGGALLSHYYFTFRAFVKGSKPPTT